MILLGFILNFLSFLPFVIKTLCFYDVNSKRVYFAVYLYGFIKILSGYVKLRKKGGVYIHLSDNLALIVDMNTLKTLKSGGFNFAKIIFPKSIFVLYDIGLNSPLIYTTIIPINSFLNSLFYSGSEFFESVDLKIKTNLYETNDKLFGIKLKTVSCFNFICIINELIANFISKLKNNKGVSNAKIKNT